MNNTYTYSQIASDFSLWQEFIDTDGVMDRETFDSTPETTLVAMIIDMFGADPNEPVITISIDGYPATIAHNAFINGMPYGISQNDANNILREVAAGKRYGRDWMMA